MMHGNMNEKLREMCTIFHQILAKFIALIISELEYKLKILNFRFLQCIFKVNHFLFAN